MTDRKTVPDASSTDLLTVIVAGGVLLAAGFLAVDRLPPWGTVLGAAVLLQIATAGAVVLLFRRHIAREREKREIAAQALAASEERLRDMAELAYDWTWETDAEHRLLSMSSRFAKAAVVTEMIGRWRFDLDVQTDDSERLLRHQADLAARRPFRDFVHYFDRNGRRRYYRSSGRPVFDRSGRFVGFRGTATEITAEMVAQAEAELAHHQLRDAIESIPEGFVLYDREDRVITINSKAREVLARPDLLVPGRQFSDYARQCAEAGLIVEAHGRVEAWLAERLDQHNRAEGVKEQQLDDGRWLRISERRTQDGGIVGVYTDITELKHREAALAEQSSLLEMTFANIGQGISLVDSDLRVVRWNEQFLKLLQFPAELFAGPEVKLEDLFRYNAQRGEYGPGDIEELVKSRVELAAKFEPHHFERSRPDGTAIEVHGSPLPGGGFVTIYTDITERKRAEAALRQSEDRYRQLVELSPDAILVHQHGLISFANSAAARMLGADGSEALVGTPLLKYVRPEFRETAQQRSKILLDHGGRAPMAEIECERLDGVVIQVEIEGILFSDDNRPAILNVARDITQRRKVEAELRSAKEAAEFASRAKTEFLANMSHELRTPLNAIIGFSEILANELFGPLGSRRYIEYADDIHASGKHLLALINDILDLSKAEAGKLELRESRVSLANVAESCVRLVRERAEHGGVRITNRVGNLPPLRADERMLKQILLNLLSNAVKFTPSGGNVEISAEREADGTMLIHIADTGIGMAPDDIPRALEAFTQVDSALSRKYDGTGLGLPLTKTLVELHGGSVAIDSVVGLGTRVSVRMPAERILV